MGRCVLPIVLALPNAIPAQSPIALGNATVELTGPWRFHTGDDPAWAQPEFVDSAWSTMDLTPPEGSYDPYQGRQRICARLDGARLSRLFRVLHGTGCA